MQPAALVSLKSDSLPPSLDAVSQSLYKCKKEEIHGYAYSFHDCMCGWGLESHSSCGSYLVSLFVGIGCMSYSQQIFDRLTYRTEHSWSNLISGYVKCGEPRKAFALYSRMQEHRVYPSGYIFVALLNACTQMKDLKKAIEMHMEIARSELLATDVFVASSLIDMYAKCGRFTRACEVFDSLPVKSVATWSALISGCAKNGCDKAVAIHFQQMQLEGFSPDAITYISTLKAYNNLGAVGKATELHDEIIKKGFEMDVIIGSSLVDIYANCGLLANAQNVFDRLPVHDVVSWTTLIAGYVKHNQMQEAIHIFREMQTAGICPNSVTFHCCLKACGSTGGVERGIEIHADIGRKGLLEKDVGIGNALIDMYCKLGLLVRAQNIFDELPVRDTVSWNTLIGGYSNHGQANKSLDCFEQMKLEGLKPDAVTFINTLKACGCVGAIDKGQEICIEIADCRLMEGDPIVCSAVIDMYANCGALAKAKELLYKIPTQDTISWTALIAGNIKHGQEDEAVNCFKQMHCECVLPNTVTFICILKACGILRSLRLGRETHAKICIQGLLAKDPTVGNALINMYSKCGIITEAREVFDMLFERDIASWNALILGFSEQDLYIEALDVFSRMSLEGILPDSVTCVNILGASGEFSINCALGLHVIIFEMGLLHRDACIGNALVDMYTSCGLLLEAQKAFDMLPIRDPITWNALIGGYVKHEFSEEALDCFKQMQIEGVCQDAITFVYILKACGSIRALDEGQEIHKQIAKSGLLKTEILVGNALVDMYAKCGIFTKAEQVFDNLLVRDTVSWNVLISGYVKHGCGEKALDCFGKMAVDGLPSSTVTYICILRACGNIKATAKGQEIHSEISRNGILERDLDVGCALVAMYAQFGMLDKAHGVYVRLIHHCKVRTPEVFNLLVSGYTEHGYPQQALEYIEEMQLCGILPDGRTFVCALKAIGDLGIVDEGLKLHGHITRKGFTEIDPIVGNALIEMYVNCGKIREAQGVFDRVAARDEVAWTILIAGYAQIGESEHTFRLFNRMRAECGQPNLMTFVGVLAACSHSGRVDEGVRYFMAMSYPSIEHFCCLLDILGRAGQMDEVVVTVNKMPFLPTPSVWHTMLSACKNWGNLELARNVFQFIVQIDAKDVTAFVSMSNIYTCACTLEDMHPSGL